MEWYQILALVIACTSAFLGFFGWSHSTTRSRIMRIEERMHSLATQENVRTVIDDKIMPVRVEYAALTRRLDDLRDSNHDLTAKIDRLLEQLAHDRKSN